MPGRIIFVSLSHCALCVLALVWWHPALAAIRAGDISVALIAVCVGTALVLGIRLQLAVVVAVIASCVRLWNPRMGAMLAQRAVWLAPSRFKAALAAAVGIVVASSSNALASPMWPSTELETPTVATPAPALPSPTWPTSGPSHDSPAPPVSHHKKPSRSRVPSPDPPPEKKATETRTYTVRHGDSLWTIAHKFGIDPDDLFKANRKTIDDPDLIFPGQELTVP